MFKLSDNYNLRKFYLQNDLAPSQTVMREKMSPALASVYFHLMGPHYKLIAGLEPPMKGGGNDWLVCPKTVLKGKTVLKPIAHKHLTKVNHLGVIEIGINALQIHKRDILAEKKKIMLDSDTTWKYVVNTVREDYCHEIAAAHKHVNRKYIRALFHQFSCQYKTAIDKMEQLLTNAAKTEIERIQKETYDKMDKRYRQFLKHQTVTITEIYRKKLADEVTRLKTEFIENVETRKTETTNTIRDLKFEKHEALASLRKFYECQNLACQIYVSLKEQEYCDKEMDLCKYQHKKKLKTLTADIAVKEMAIKIAEEIEKKQLEEKAQRRKILCKIVKKFQLFVSYCLSTLPEHAEFFINMEKLMLLQVNETLENPCADSIIVEEPEEQFHTPIPRPRPFYLFCDKGYKAQVNQDLCPVKCASDASQLPVIVVNQRCMYAACDNFDQFTEKITNHIHHIRGDDADVRDDLNYDQFVPVKYTTSQQLKEMKLESSLVQILQQEVTIRKDLSICYCKAPEKVKKVVTKPIVKLKKVVSSTKTLPAAGPSTILEHEREPKLEKYFDYVEPRKCTCGKMAKKHLLQNLPAYMTTTSKYEDLELLNYEKCPVSTLKRLVKQASGHIDTPTYKVFSRTKNVGTQYSDIKFDLLCRCFSNSEADLLLKDYIIGQRPHPKTGETSRISLDSVSPSYLQQKASSFATDRAHSLRQLLNKSPELQELFRSKNC